MSGSANGDSRSAGCIANLSYWPWQNLQLSVLVGFFDRSFYPHLDQMQHRSVDHPSSHRLHQFGMWNTIEVAAEIRIHDLLMSGVDQLVDMLI